MFTLDVILLLVALLLTIWALVRNAMPYLGVAMLLIIVDLLIHIIPR